MLGWRCDRDVSLFIFELKFTCWRCNETIYVLVLIITQAFGKCDFEHGERSFAPK